MCYLTAEEHEINAERERLAEVCFILDCGEELSSDTRDIVLTDLQSEDDITRMMAQYAHDKAKANELRRIGLIDDALAIERACDALYRQIPKPLRW